MAEKQGCSAIVVFMIATVALLVGAGVGAGAIYFWAQSSPESFGIEAQASEQTAANADPAKTGATGKEERYALLYPIEESLRIEGSLPPKSVTDKVKDKRYPMRKCYQDALEKDSSLKGEVSLQFTVSGDTGRVVAAVERHTDIGNEALKKCILDEVKTWELAKTSKGDSVVKFDLLLIPIAGTPDL